MDYETQFEEETKEEAFINIPTNDGSYYSASYVNWLENKLDNKRSD